MHALLVVFVTEAMSHAPMSWLKAAALLNTARPHHTATPPALAHPRSTTRTAPRKTNNHATVLYSTRIHSHALRPPMAWPHVGVCALGVMILWDAWGWISVEPREEYARTKGHFLHRGHVP